MSFQVIVLGSSGGPKDGSTSSLLIRSSSVAGDAEDCFLAIDAGCFVSAIQHTLVSHPSHFASSVRQQSPWHVVNHLVSGIYLTHPHLDHIAGFIMNTAGLSAANPKKLCGLARSIDSVKANIFNGVIWPNLTNEGTDAANCVILVRLDPKLPLLNAAAGLDVIPLPISHGQSWSTAYIVTDQVSSRTILVWGDVEPDAVSRNPLNYTVWQEIANRYDTLSGIIIECSYDSSYEGELYGHMTPPHLVNELNTLARLVNHNLDHLPVIINHIKDHDTDIGEKILSDLQTLAQQQSLACRFIISRPSLSIYL